MDSKGPKTTAEDRKVGAERPVIVILLRDGKEVTRGTDFEIVQYIHKNHSFSLDHALKHEGYSLKEAPDAGRAALKDKDK